MGGSIKKEWSTQHTSTLQGWKNTIFNNGHCTTNISSDPHTVTTTDISTTLISCRLDYCNSLLYNVPTHKTDRLQRLQNQRARIFIKSPSTLLRFKKPYIGSKFRIELHIKYWRSHINRTTTLHRLIYVNWLAGEKVLLIPDWKQIITN